MITQPRRILIYSLVGCALFAATQVDWNTQIKNRPFILTPPVLVTQGGTGANTAAGARTNLAAAATGANGDITSLTAINSICCLTTPLTVAQGGTGVTTAQGNGTKVQLATGTTTNGNILFYDVNGNAADSGTANANMVTATAAPAANQLCAPSGTSKVCTWVDLPETHVYPSGACNVTTPGPGWSIPTANGAIPACRTGSNVNAGLLEFTAANQTAQFQAELPADWDSSTNPYIRLLLTQGNANGSQTITMQVQVSCGATDDAAFQTAQSLPNITTGTTADTQYTTTVQLNNTSMTGCSAGNLMNLKIIANAIGTNQAWVQAAIMTFPRRVIVQAN